jgi:hypothetical protein
VNLDGVQTRTAVAYGLVGGAAGGLAMAVWMMIKSASAGQGFWAPVSMCMASFVYRDWAKNMMDEMTMMAKQGQVMPSGFEGIHGLVGIVMHMVVSMTFGVIFAVVLSGGLGQRWGVAGTTAGGVIYGTAIWLVMQFAILPIVNQLMLENVTEMVGTWVFFVGHLLFGLVVGAVVGWQYRTQAFQSRAVHAH